MGRDWPVVAAVVVVIASDTWEAAESVGDTSRLGHADFARELAERPGSGSGSGSRPRPPPSPRRRRPRPRRRRPRRRRPSLPAAPPPSLPPPICRRPRPAESAQPANDHSPPSSTPVTTVSNKLTAAAVQQIADTADTTKDNLNQDAATAVSKVTTVVTECQVGHPETCTVVASGASSRRRLASSGTNQRRLVHLGYEYTITYQITSTSAADAAASGATDTATTSAVTTANTAITSADVDERLFEHRRHSGRRDRGHLSGATVTAAAANGATITTDATVSLAMPSPPPPPPCASVCTRCRRRSADRRPVRQVRGHGVVCRPLFGFKAIRGRSSARSL